jgi:hypothetical protein
MTDDFLPPLNVHGLFVHFGARRAIEAFVREKQVGVYPMYLVGMAMPEHRGGPALVTLLTLADGGVVNAHARSLRKKLKVNGVLQYDVGYLNGNEIQHYRRIFYEDYGGFSAAGCLESSPTAAAEQMLDYARLGIQLAGQVGPSPQGPPKGYPSDWTDVVYYSQDAVGCTVEGFAPSADLVDTLEVPESLKRAMQLADSPDLAWLDAWADRVAAEIHPQIPALVEEAWAIRLVSPRASVALLRSVAELVAQSLVDNTADQFYAALKALEAKWMADPPGDSPAGRREGAWRASVMSCFHTVRDLGNRIHADSVVTRGDLDLAHSSNQRLLEAVLRAGPLDRAPTTN